ncbi:hypothetical protein LINGRAHAP2_LOCUS30425 [Linum grandiflorum]
MNSDSSSSPSSPPSHISENNSENHSAVSNTTTMATSSNGTNSDQGSGGISVRKFTGKNYLQWSQSVQMFITGKSKGEYLTGAAAKPAESDAAAFTKWDNDDNQVRFWLISTMEPDIGDNYLLHQSAKTLWDDVKETYSTQDNSSALFEIESKLYNFKQGEMSATEYYNKLCRTWLELDLYEKQTWECTADAKTFRTFVEKKRTVQMLLGLRQDLDVAKSRVMGTKPFPSLREAFAEVLREEDRRRLMIAESKPGADGSAFQAETQATAMAAQANRNKGKGKPTVWCDYCRLPHHTKEECWEIIGGPPGWKSKMNQPKLHKPRANATTSKGTEDEAQFSKGQLDLLQKMFTQVLKTDKGEPKGFVSSLFQQSGSGNGNDPWQW